MPKSCKSPTSLGPISVREEGMRNELQLFCHRGDFAWPDTAASTNSNMSRTTFLIRDDFESGTSVPWGTPQTYLGQDTDQLVSSNGAD